MTDDTGYVTGINTGGEAEGDSVPRVAVQTHLDGDPRPREAEVRQWDEIRKENGLDEFIALILLPDESVTDGRFPGHSMHWWRIIERDGEPVVEPTEIDLQVIPDDTVYELPDGSEWRDGARGPSRSVHVCNVDGDVSDEARANWYGQGDGRHVAISPAPGGGLMFVYAGDSERALDMVREALIEAEAQLRPPTTAEVLEGQRDWDRVHREIMDVDGDRMAFRVTRTRLDDRTFSAEAVEGLARQVMTFVLARCHAFWKRTGAPARDLTLYADLRIGADGPRDGGPGFEKRDSPLADRSSGRWGLGSDRGPYGTNEGDMWLGEDSTVGQMLKERDGLTLVHEMMVKDDELQECLYCTDNPELIAEARAGHEQWVTAQAAMN